MTGPRVLFTKNFSVTAAQIQALHGSGYEVWASHTDPQHGMLAAAPHTLLEPRGAIGTDYVDWLLGACQQQGIQWVIPGKERELLASYQEDFEAVGTRLIAPATEATQRHLERKDEFLRDWDTTILPIPRWSTFQSVTEFDAAYDDLKQPGVRLCMKPARGIYASGFRVLLEKPDPVAFLKGELYQMSVQAAKK